jgi:hypothetical protein
MEMIVTDAEFCATNLRPAISGFDGLTNHVRPDGGAVAC